MTLVTIFVMYSFGEDWYSKELVVSLVGVMDDYDLGLC